MNSLGFKNFRKFVALEPLDLKGITFLVGRNNAGKSTFVKAMILILEYFKRNSLKDFPIGNLDNAEINIANFGRAKNAFEINNDLIEFTFSIQHYKVDIEISANPEAKVADVHKLIIEDKKSGYIFNLEPVNNHINISYSYQEKLKNSISENDLTIKALRQQIKSLRKELKSIDQENDLRSYIDKKDQIENVANAIKILNNLNKKNKHDYFSFSVSIDEDSGWYDNSINHCVNEFLQEQDFKLDRVKERFQKSDKVKLNKFEQKQLLNLERLVRNTEAVKQSFDAFLEAINTTSYKYLASTAQKQSNLLLIKDKGNPLAIAVHDFYETKCQPGEPPYEFVLKWMNAFDVGESFEIKKLVHEAYEVNIINHAGSINISEKGMGSIQIMILIFRLASLINNAIKMQGNFLVLIEEPELNLHPAFQSKLADLFHVVNNDFNIKLIVETHSEYLIRKTQLIVKDKEYEVKPNENPFSVIYFDKDLIQWTMNYREDGKFIEEFGKGFYDESALLTLNLL
jgi:predicted ATPase